MQSTQLVSADAPSLRPHNSTVPPGGESRFLASGSQCGWDRAAPTPFITLHQPHAMDHIGLIFFWSTT